MDSGGANAGSSDSAKPSSTEPATLPGCGCASATNITVRVTPTTGGQFDLQVAKTESVENLKKLISKKLKVPKERICLLHRDRQLREGTLQENQLMDGSRLTLLPSVETGLLAQRPEQSVMQALESLNDSQVNDFLSGKAPLNLTMRLGDHMMLIQLQLSTVTPSSSRRSTSSTTGTTTTTTSTSTASPSLLTASRSSLASSLSSVIAGAAAASKHCALNKSTPPATTAAAATPAPSQKTTTTTTTTVYPSTPPTPPNTPNASAPSSPSQVKVTSSSSSSSGFKFSPPTSPPAKPFTSFFSKPAVPLDSSNTATNLESSSSSSTPLTTFTTVTSTSESAQTSSPSSTTSTSPSRSVMVCKLPFKSLDDVKGLLGKKLVETVKKHSSSCTAATTTTTAMSTSSTAPVATSATTSTSTSSSSTSSTTTSSSSSTSSSPSSSAASSPGGGAAAPCKCDPPSKPTLDTRALAEASRNLTQTLKQLSSEVLTSRTDPAEDSARARRQGAIIESMHHHGKGVYSGTFSGTLNPALQDRFGRPKRDISTIIHILNDLLCATPQYRRHARQGHTITVEATSGTPKPGSAASDKGPSSLDLLEESVSLSRENQATRGKMEHLRLIMEERRARRRARREARAAPYTTQWSAKSESLPQSPAMGRDQGEPMETGEQPSGSEQQLCEPVVA